MLNQEKELKTRKENIKAIADACRVTHWVGTLGRISVVYKNQVAGYDINGKRPKYLTNFVPMPPLTTATNQYVIDGMRLAAQRVIDKRERTRKAEEAIDGSMKSLGDSLTLKIRAMANMAFSELAIEYVEANNLCKKMGADKIAFDKPTYERMQKIMGLADEIACARFGAGFYTP